MNFAIIVSEFNPEITNGLLKGALDFFHTREIKIAHENIFHAPGAFELPLIAKRLAQSKRYDGIICLGCVIKGETAHFEFISLGTSMGIMQAMLQTDIPISFGVLTTYSDEQALARSQNNAENKGREAANACLQTASLIKKL